MKAEAFLRSFGAGFGGFSSEYSTAIALLVGGLDWIGQMSLTRLEYDRSGKVCGRRLECDQY